MSLCKHSKNLVFLLFTLLIIAISSRLYLQSHSQSHHAYYYNTLTHMDPLILGSLSAFLLPKLRRHQQWLSLIFLSASIIGLLSIMIGLPDIFHNHKSITLTMTGIALAWSSFLISLITLPWLKKCFTLKPLMAIGKITYGLYLLHYPIMVTYSRLINKHLGHLSLLTQWGLLFSLTLCSSLLLASISWAFYEKPFNRLRYYYSRRPAVFKEPLTALGNFLL